jgi:hypothetical protein
MGELRRITFPPRPGPYLPDIVRELREARDQVDHVFLLSTCVEPPLESRLGAEVANRLAGAVLELEAALEMIEAGSAA